MCDTSNSLAQPNCSFRKTNTANEICSKWSSASLLQIDYNWGVVFPTSPLISTATPPLVLFLERVVPVWQLGVSEEAWCVVSLLDVTLFTPVILFLICCVKVMLSLLFFFVFLSIFFGCVSHSSHPHFFSLPFLPFCTLMWRRCHWCGSCREDEKIRSRCRQGRHSPITGGVFFHLWLIKCDFL